MDKPKQESKKMPHTHGHPPRVAPRLEGVVKNVGIKPKLKKKGKFKRRKTVVR